MQATPRRVGALVLLAVAAGIFVAGYAIAAERGLLVALAAGQVLLIAVALAAWRELRQAQRRLRAGLREVDARLERSSAALQDATKTSERRTVQAVNSLGKEHSRHTDHLRAALRKQFQQIEALGALYYGMRPEQPIPPTRSWSASPDLLRYLYESVRQGRQRLVLECGSGVSTLVFAYGLRARGDDNSRVVALEHDQHYAEVTQELLRDHGLAAWAEVRFAPLKPVTLDDESWPWYDLSTCPDGPIDLLLVDGPPGATRSKARFPAVPMLYDRLAPGAEIVLDDHDRPHEQEVAKRWQELFPELTTELLRHEKGTLVLRRPPA